jgi:hypothetical protein
MNIAEMRREPAVETLRAGTIDMELEIVVIPVSDVDRAKRFYGDLGFSLEMLALRNFGLGMTTSARAPVSSPMFTTTLCDYRCGTVGSTIIAQL